MKREPLNLINSGIRELSVKHGLPPLDELKKILSFNRIYIIKEEFVIL